MRRRPVEINVNHERWLISYADFITLLFAFFVVMYSISQVNESKYRVLSATLTDIFNEPKRTLEPIQVGDLARALSPEAIELAELQKNQDSGGPFDRTADLPQLSDQFTEQFADLIDDRVVQVNSNEYWLQISLNNSILFPLGSVEPSREANTVLAEIANLLRGFNNPIQVEGYTDNLPVNSRQFPSNWELSAARASSIVKLFIDEGISPERLAAVGYGDTHPIAENETPEGRAQNRRVVLMIAREKTQRPRVSTLEAIEEAVAPPGREEVPVNPIQGQSPAQESLNALSAEERMDTLIETNPELGLDTVLQLEDEARPISEPESEQEPGLILDDDGRIKPIETKSGGLLFTSDPELQRGE